MPKTYGHYCPVAHALEIVGDRWSLLIIRDLLRKPQRFTDLLRYSSNLSPKWLTLRLRKLEQADIIEREKGQDQREVWYRLTSAGQDLKPVVEALGIWGMKYVMPPPLPGETVHPELAVNTLAASLNRRDRKLSQPASWQITFTPGGPYTLYFNGESWTSEAGVPDNPDVTVTISPEAWVTFLAVKRDERSRLAQSIQIDGSPEHVEEFLHTLGVRNTKTRQLA